MQVMSVGRQCIPRTGFGRLGSKLHLIGRGPCKKAKSWWDETWRGVQAESIAKNVRQDCDPPALARKFPAAHMLGNEDFRGTFEYAVARKAGD